jgi:hypothetical protein
MTAERGYVTVATAVFATAVLAFLGLVTDMGYLQWQKMRAQTAADAAAAGAGLQLLGRRRRQYCERGSKRSDQPLVRSTPPEQSSGHQRDLSPRIRARMMTQNEGHRTDRHQAGPREPETHFND